MKNSSAYAIPNPYNRTGEWAKTTGEWAKTTGETVTQIGEKLGTVIGSGRADTSKRSLGASTKAAAIDLAKMLGATTLSSALAWSMASVVALGFDWGYQFIAGLAGQPASAQGVIAAMALWFLVLPASFGLWLGAFRKAWNGSASWVFMPVLLVSAYTLWNIELSSDAFELLHLSVLCAVGWAASIPTYVLGQKLCSALESRVNPWNVLLPLAAAWAPIGILSWTDTLEFNFNAQAILFMASVFAAAYATASGAQQESLSKSLRLTMLATAPILGAIVLNVTGTALCSYLEVLGVNTDMGWRASASALTVALSTILALVAGTSAGTLLSRKPKSAG